MTIHDLYPDQPPIYKQRLSYTSIFPHLINSKLGNSVPFPPFDATPDHPSPVQSWIVLHSDPRCYTTPGITPHSPFSLFPLPKGAAERASHWLILVGLLGQTQEEALCFFKSIIGVPCLPLCFCAHLYSWRQDFDRLGNIQGRHDIMWISVCSFLCADEVSIT